MDDELLTTGQAAVVLGCSRQHVVDLCSSGRLAYMRVGTHRRVRPADLDAFLGRSLTRDQERSLWLHHAVAGHLVRDPQRVIGRAFRGLTRLRDVHRDGAVTRSLDEWEAVLQSGPDHVLQTLTSRDLPAVELRQNSPFAGVLTDEERQAVLTAFQESWRRRRAAA